MTTHPNSPYPAPGSTSTPQQALADAAHGAMPPPHDPVVAATGGLGRPVDLTGLRSLQLEGPHVLWLVAAGEVDLFAVDAQLLGHWHYLGRLATGTLLLGPVHGARHTLVARPLAGSAVRRIELRELHPADAQTAAGWETGQWEAYGAGRPSTGQWYAAQWQAQHAQQQGVQGQFAQPTQPTPLEDAFARGIGRGLRVLYQAPLDGRRGPQVDAGEADEDILWMHIPPGSVHYGAVHEAEAAGTLLVDGAMWRGMLDQQYRLLHALDEWIEHAERTHEDRTAAGIRAGEDARQRADRTLLDSISRRSGGSSGEDEDATLAACRIVARHARITLVEPREVPEADRRGAVERIAEASRVRTREVRLGERWWREDSGPLVGRRAGDGGDDGDDESGAPVALVRRRGRYEAIDPVTGERERIGARNAERFAARAVMFHRPLPDRPLGLLRLLGFSLRGTRSDLRTLILGGLVAVGLGTLVPLATGRVLGEFVPNAEVDLIRLTTLALAVSAVVAAVFLLLQNISVLRMEGRIESVLQPAVWDRLLRLPTRFFAERSTGELASAAMGISQIRRVLSGIGSVAIQSCTIGGVNLVLLLVFSVPLALAALGILLLVAGVFIGLGMWQLRWQRQLVRLGNQLNNRAFQTLRGLPKLRVAAAESFAYAAWAREFARTRELQQRVGRIKNIITVLNAVYLPLATLTMFALLAGPARGSMAASSFLTFNTSVTMLLSSVTQLTGALLSAAAVQPMFEQVRPIFQETPEVREGSVRPGELSGELEVSRLSFRYSEEGPLVLDDVSFTVRPGEFVALVGASGCGKSTLLRLLIGFDEPLSGSVRYDGQDLSALDQAAVRRQLGVVLQDAQPFTGSILECLAGTESYTLDEAWEAAARAGLAEDIKAMPMGMHTMLSDGGGTVSGGQRQRLMIAQALIRKPRLLFLDEATSALDNRAQRTVIEATRDLDATRVLIAHRLSTVLDADRVLVLDQGRLVEQGAPAELLADEEGVFRNLVRRQLQ